MSEANEDMVKVKSRDVQKQLAREDAEERAEAAYLAAGAEQAAAIVKSFPAGSKLSLSVRSVRTDKGLVQIGIGPQSAVPHIVLMKPGEPVPLPGDTVKEFVHDLRCKCEGHRGQATHAQLVLAGPGGAGSINVATAVALADLGALA